MEQTLNALGGLLLKALPTFLLVLVLHYYLKYVFFKPLEKVLQQRFDATEGARKTAEQSLARAEEKARQYETALRQAKAEVYHEQEQIRRKLQADRADRVREARQKTDAAVAQGKAALEAEVEQLKTQLGAESEALAEQIAQAVLRRRVA
jgi:F-type H+-transporting ATPase subunit b